MDVVLLGEVSLNGKSTNLQTRETYLLINELIPCDGIFMDETTAFNAVNDLEFESEELKHKKKKAYDKNLPLLIISDFKGILQGYLHMFREREELRDVIIIINNKTPDVYIKYLEEREYTYVFFSENIDTISILKFLEEKFEIKKLRLEGTAQTQKKILNQCIASEMYLLIDAIISQNKLEGFDNLDYSEFELLEARALNKKMILSHYKVN